MKTRKRNTQSTPAVTRVRTRTNDRPLTLTPRRILVPLDFSGQSRQALETAVPLAERYGGKITLVHVVEPAYVGDGRTIRNALCAFRILPPARTSSGEWFGT